VNYLNQQAEKESFPVDAKEGMIADATANN
jgi:hypothetical protein